MAGTTTIDGISNWNVGDWALNANGVWNKIDNSESVSSVFGRLGAVVAQPGD